MPKVFPNIRNAFISYAKEHEVHAKFIRDALSELFPETINFFIASDPHSIPAGGEWYKTIVKNLKSAHFFFILLSPNNVGKPWLLFEAGAAVCSGVKVITIRFCGLPSELVPTPLSPFQSIDICNKDEVRALLGDLASVKKPTDAKVRKSATKIVGHFQGAANRNPEPIMVERILPPVEKRIAHILQSSEMQRKLFLHILNWQGNQGVMESAIRDGINIPYYHHDEKKRKKIQSSPSEYYYRLREFYHLGILDMKKESTFENRWWVHKDLMPYGKNVS